MDGYLRGMDWWMMNGWYRVNELRFIRKDSNQTKGIQSWLTMVWSTSICKGDGWTCLDMELLLTLSYFPKLYLPKWHNLQCWVGHVLVSTPGCSMQLQLSRTAGDMGNPHLCVWQHVITMHGYYMHLCTMWYSQKLIYFVRNQYPCCHRSLRRPLTLDATHCGNLGKQNRVMVQNWYACWSCHLVLIVNMEMFCWNIHLPIAWQSLRRCHCFPSACFWMTNVGSPVHCSTAGTPSYCTYITVLQFKNENINTSLLLNMHFHDQCCEAPASRWFLPFRMAMIMCLKMVHSWKLK